MFENSENRINFIPCIKWVKKGVAKSNPEKVQLTKEELVQIINQTRSQLPEIEEAENASSSQDVPMNEDDEFNFANYDNDESNAITGLGLGSIAELPNDVTDNFSESDDSDKEDEIIKPEDNLILVGRVDGDASILEIYVQNEDESSLYVHHDFLLPAFPLCIEWLDYEPDHPPGNYCAIGSMTPIIEIWDLDVINCLEPAYKLGRKASRKKGLSQIGHKDAVLDLSWNKVYHHILASGSVDQTILLWDIDKKEPSTCIKAFEEKVQCVEWHRLEAQTLLAGACDQTAKVFDCRSPDNHQTWKLSGEAEKLSWHPLQPFQFIVGSNTGTIQCFDCREGQLWSLEAHTKEVTGLAISDKCPGLLVSTSAEGDLKIWDIIDNSQPQLVHQRDLNLGTVHCLELNPNSPFVIAAGGDNKSNNFTVLDLLTEDIVQHRFGSRQLIQPNNASISND